MKMVYVRARDRDYAQEGDIILELDIHNVLIFVLRNKFVWNFIVYEPYSVDFTPSYRWLWFDWSFG